MNHEDLILYFLQKKINGDGLIVNVYKNGRYDTRKIIDGKILEYFEPIFSGVIPKKTIISTIHKYLGSF